MDRDSCPSAWADGEAADMEANSARAMQYRAHFCQRTRLAREAAGFTRRQMAKLLGLTIHSYTKNEDRSPLAHMNTQTFLSMTKVSYEWLSQGIGSGPALDHRELQRS